MMRRLVTLQLALPLVGVFSSPLLASDLYWDGTGTSWNNASSWSTASGATTPDPGVKANGGDIARFNISTVNAPQTVNLDANQNAAGLVFTSTGPVNIRSGSGSNTLTIGANGMTVD